VGKWQAFGNDTMGRRNFNGLVYSTGSTLERIIPYVALRNDAGGELIQ
jgi:hypothetical protein